MSIPGYRCVVSLGCWLLGFAMISIAIEPGPLAAQTSPRSNAYQDHLNAGEMTLAIEHASTLPAANRDRALAQISAHQVKAGSPAAAMNTAGMMGDDRMRANLVNDVANGNAGNGMAGGITAQDFTPLIDLITNTISSDSWLDTGTGLGTIQAYPAGVYVDSTGTLKKIKIDDTRMTRMRNRVFASSDQFPGLDTDLRKISLTRLEKDAQLLAAQGLAPTAEMQNLAGMTEVKYVIAIPETGDLVIAGPAGPWKKDASGRSINIENGKPVLQLDDLVLCLRNAWSNNGKFGCAITPRQANLAATQRFLATSKLKGQAWRNELRKVLGQQDVEVFGIPAGTHAARVLVEADYRMKLLGMGLEPSIPGVPSFLDRVELQPDGTPPPMDVVRWWFTLNYDDVIADSSRLAFTFTGPGVKVLSENEMLDAQGQRIHTGTSHGPTKAFARDFTRHFDQLAIQYPIYRELKNVFDMALVASLIRHQGLAEKVNWNLTYFGVPNQPDQLRFAVPQENVARQVDSVMNHREIRTRKGRTTLKHTIVGVSGGISYDALDVMSEERIKSESGQEMATLRNSAKPDREIEGWWWN